MARFDLWCVPRESDVDQGEREGGTSRGGEGREEDRLVTGGGRGEGGVRLICLSVAAPRLAPKGNQLPSN
jgi:hypothetical protein